MLYFCASRNYQMKLFLFKIGMFLAFFIIGSGSNAQVANVLKINSPNGLMELKFYLDADGSPRYAFKAEGLPIVKDGRLGIVLKDQNSLDKGFVLDSSYTNEIDDTWTTVWGEERQIRNHYKSLNVKLTQGMGSEKRVLNLEFRLFNDGLGFRYIFPEDGNLGLFTVRDELTTFPLDADHDAYWIPGDYDTNEFRYSRSKLSQVHSMQFSEDNNIAFKQSVHDSLVQTPLMMIAGDGYYLAIHEAALLHYPAMNLEIDRNKLELKSHLVPDVLGNKAYLQGGDKTPWRVILYAKKAKDILTNRIILNLNEPSKIPDPSFIKPGKFIGVWWEMHVGKSSWNYWDKSTALSSKFWKQTKHHGANTANVIRYIDFAAKHDIPYVLVEGWNEGWEDWFGAYREHIFSFSKPYPDFDINAISSRAKAKNVKLIMHHETSGAVTDYERQLDTAIRFMIQHGYPGIKGGYVGKIIPRGEHHDGQWMVDHYERVASKFGLNKMTVDLHEPVRPTGLHRTYPNWWSNEAARGNEFNAWSRGNLPEHETILPFTRLLGGPMDYTPGIFQIKMNVYDSAKKEQVHTTLTKQLALYVTLYSPIQMAADLIENYEKRPDAFKFIKEVPTDWDTTVVLDAEPGDYIYIARRERNGKQWFVGAITDEQERLFEPDLSFLTPGKKYNMVIYRDGETADWEKNPMSYIIDKKTIRSTEKLKIRLAPGGGCAIQFTPTGR